MELIPCNASDLGLHSIDGSQQRYRENIDLEDFLDAYIAPVLGTRSQQTTGIQLFRGRELCPRRRQPRDCLAIASSPAASDCL